MKTGGENIARFPMRKRILVVEDEMLIAFGTMVDLEDAGFEVVVTKDGRQGLEAAASEQFDLIITDNNMPNMTGVDMISALRKAGNTLPIVLTSALNPQSLPFASGPGYDRFLAKPYRPGQLCDLARELTDRVGAQRVAGMLRR